MLLLLGELLFYGRRDMLFQVLDDIDNRVAQLSLQPCMLVKIDLLVAAASESGAD